LASMNGNMGGCPLVGKFEWNNDKDTVTCLPSCDDGYSGDLKAYCGGYVKTATLEATKTHATSNWIVDGTCVPVSNKVDENQQHLPVPLPDPVALDAKDRRRSTTACSNNGLRSVLNAAHFDPNSCVANLEGTTTSTCAPLANCVPVCQAGLVSQTDASVTCCNGEWTVQGHCVNQTESESNSESFSNSESSSQSQSSSSSHSQSRSTSQSQSSTESHSETQSMSISSSQSNSDSESSSESSSETSSDSESSAQSSSESNSETSSGSESSSQSSSTSQSTTSSQSISASQSETKSHSLIKVHVTPPDSSKVVPVWAFIVAAAAFLAALAAAGPTIFSLFVHVTSQVPQRAQVFFDPHTQTWMANQAPPGQPNGATSPFFRIQPTFQ